MKFLKSQESFKTQNISKLISEKGTKMNLEQFTGIES